MNNASSSSSPNPPHPKSEPIAHANEANHILDVVFDYTGNGDDELTLRSVRNLINLSAPFAAMIFL